MATIEHGQVHEPVLRFDDGAAYECFMGRWSRAAGAVFLDWLAPPPGARWLDVGCGTGVFTQLVLDRCAPLAVYAVDPAQPQIDHARRHRGRQGVTFQVADAQALPFADWTFDVVSSALVINFIPDPFCAISEMRRVARRGGLVAGYIWDFAAELSPSWPLRRAMRQCGFDVPDVPGASYSSPDVLQSLFRQAGCKDIEITLIDVGLPFADFDEFWDAQTSSYTPTARTIAAMTENDRLRLIETVRIELPVCTEGRIEYWARANAIRASAPASKQE